jgi:hypothetical protein
MDASPDMRDQVRDAVAPDVGRPRDVFLVELLDDLQDPAHFRPELRDHAVDQFHGDVRLHLSHPVKNHFDERPARPLRTATAAE